MADTPTASPTTVPPAVPVPIVVPKSRYLLFFGIAVVGLVLDLWSKRAVFESLGYPGGQTGWFFQTNAISFKFYTTFNEGALWGLGQGFSWLFALFSVIAFVAILVWLFVFRAAISVWLTVTLALITAGTLGNLYDRLGVHGLVNTRTGEVWKAVRDFFYFRLGSYDYPIFNVADICLVTGAIMLLIQSFRPIEPETASVPAKT